MSWYEEIPGLPFQPEEEEVLKKIIDNAQDFRNHIAAYCNPVLSTANEAETQRFYLRKIEGAEILLAYETNFFRQELHKWSPVAPQAPPVIEFSKSTRKPRPTKLQKLLQQYGVDDPEDLPEAAKAKAASLKRKALNAEAAAAAAAAASGSGNGSAISPGAHGYGGHHPFFGRSTSSQPQTPGLSITSSSHAHPSRGPDSSTSSHGHAQGRSGSSGPILKPDAMDIDSGPGIHPGFFMPDGAGPQLLADSNSNLSLEERLLRENPDDVNGADFSLLTDAAKEKALEILSRTETGRRRAEELLGRGIWSDEAGTQNEEVDGGDMDRMFADMTNQDDDEDDGGKRSNDNAVTAESLESERNGMDALLDSD